MKKAFFRILAISFLFQNGLALAGHDGSILRTPEYPLKVERRIYPPEEVKVALSNIARYPTARSVAEAVIQRASQWLEWDDSDLLELIPASTVPRAFNVGTAGCPVCGKKIYEKGGTYPWILDLRKFFKVKCPICEREFPDNDFKAYYDSGFQNKDLLRGRYVDDGWGWVDPDGRRYWFVAYANHWNLYQNVIPGIRDLSRAYILTGKLRFAHKAALMLYRIAEVYPAMDYHSQSRYGYLQAKRGVRYEGKIVNAIWETEVLTMLAEAYDSVWETIDSDQSLQELVGKSGNEIRAHIEANLLEEGIDSVFQRKIAGNYGMHQKALVYAALARDQGPLEEWLDSISNGISDDLVFLGLNYALYDLIYRDGIPYETSPGYNFSWVKNITSVAENLKKAGKDVYRIPRMKRLYDGVLDLINIRKHTPSLGDSGSVYGGIVGADSFTFQSAYRAYKDPRYRRFLASIGRTGPAGFNTFETLFHPVIDEDEESLPPQPSRLLDGYGMGILSDPEDRTSLSLYYGYAGGHGHFDRLHFDIFSNGWPMTPDLGYPDFMNSYVPGIYTWSKNTISHNTVTVDASRQTRKVKGTVHLFADSPFVRVIDVDAEGTYPQCSIYRRRIVMVDIDPERSYFIDCFTVTGGSQHDYSLHGPPGKFRMIGGSWTDPATGTLAGTDVPLGKIYDDPVLGAPDYGGVYHGYTGSGFQHLFHVQRHLDGNWVAEWSHEKDPDAHLRIRVLDQPGQEVLVADAQVSPVKHKQLIKYLIARRAGKNLASCFVSILEPFRKSPFISDAELVAATPPDTFVIRVHRRDGLRDRIRFGTTGPTSVDADLTQGSPEVIVASEDQEGRIQRLFLAGGSFHKNGNGEGTFLQGLKGTVHAVYPGTRRIEIQLDSIPETVEPDSLVGQIVYFQNQTRRTAHPIDVADLQGRILSVTTRDDLLIGHAHASRIESSTLQIDTPLYFADLYAGTWLTDPNFKQFLPIRGASRNQILLDSRPADNQGIWRNREVWVVDVGPGDRFEFQPLHYRTSYSPDSD